MTKITDPFYKSARWRKKREKILRRDKYICQYFKRYGKIRQADTVHHILPREQFPEYQWADWNLISLSHEAHNRMHYRDTHELTNTGKELIDRIKNKIPEKNISEIKMPEEKKESRKKYPGKFLTLIVGLPGTGKSTFAKELLGDTGIAFDLDAIASAFRLRQPHEEYHNQSRHMANDFLHGFIYKARDYSDNIVIIRTAPTIEEAEEIDPDCIVCMRQVYVERQMDNERYVLRRLAALTAWAEAHDIPIKYPPV